MNYYNFYYPCTLVPKAFPKSFFILMEALGYLNYISITLIPRVALYATSVNS